MIFIPLNEKETHLVMSYDGVSFSIWNNTNGAIVGVRKKIRSLLFSQQQYRCAYCKIEKKETHGLVWDIDHILPKSKHPAFIFDFKNLALSCKECNIAKGETEVLKSSARKYTSFPNQSSDYKIVHPHFDTYSDHFEIIIIGRKRMYRVKNEHKAKETYQICNFFRFDCRFSEWEVFDSAIVEAFTTYLSRFPSDMTTTDIMKVLPGVSFTESES